MKLSTMFIIFIILITPYIWNGYKLTNCDFKSDYKCEIIHAIGIIGPLAYVTVWFDDDNKGEN